VARPTNKLWSKMLAKAERDTLDIGPLMGKSPARSANFGPAFN
jgi:hypothetical protein